MTKTDSPIMTLLSTRCPRLLPFSVRPRYRETPDSYSRRIMQANMLGLDHLRALTKAHASAALAAGNLLVAWFSLLGALTGRLLDRLNPDAHGWLTHPDGTSCEHCAELLTERWMCTLCAHGEHIQQHAHFDAPVCIHHQRWIGLSDLPGQQHPVDQNMVRAAITFNKLRRSGRLDVRLFLLLTTAVSRNDDGHPSAATFPLVVSIARLITRRDFQTRLFDPARTFAASFTFLTKAMQGPIDDTILASKVARALWLYARPTFHALSRDAEKSEPTAHWPHDWTVDSTIIQTYRSTTDALQPLHKYLAVATFTGQQAARFGLPEQGDRKTTRAPGSTKVYATHLCPFGHEYTARILKGTNVIDQKIPACQYCTGREIQPGVNDLASRAPKIGAELAIKENGGTRPENIAVSDRRDYFWQCPVDSRHVYPASPSNRVHAKSTCPICLNRLILPGINDVATTHPATTADWDPAALEQDPPTKFSAGSKKWIPFLCPNGHHITMAIVDRVTAGKCPDCIKLDTRSSRDGLPITHPDIAEQWHPTLNGDNLPGDFTHGSRFSVWWDCPNGHPYQQRIERKVNGYGCPICTRRTFRSGGNDIATLHPTLAPEFHPYMNGVRTAAETKAGVGRYWWRCGNNHKTQQSIVHRYESKGCTECPPAGRLLAE
ncbi:hypothetical protein ABIB54_003131 [Frigoribacterium sp. UYMn621]